MTTVARKRGPYARTTQRREEIARAVLEVVEEAGHDSVTIAMVAERSGVAEATVLYHFPSRDHLLVAALELSDQDAVAVSHADDEDAALSLEELRAAVSSFEFGGRLTRLALLLKGQTATPDHPAVAYFAARSARQIAIFTKLVARRQRDGLAHPGLDARQVAIQLIATWDGLTALWLVDPAIDVADLLVDAYRRLAGENVVEARALVASSDFGL
ncbi:TetR/AcrR family transcriptional regulator [Agromyces sp. MMS24-JH15]|uniref:TetR/AcrR family transcriptional regulator n=1 Tax=Agromyces sp. MMS24-JH15 TaxID=3243765 RepID=UPI003747FE61